MDHKPIELVLDVETVGLSLEEDFSSYERHSLTKYDEENSKFEDRMALYPQSGVIVAVGGKNMVSGKGFVFFQAGDEFKEPDELDKNLTLYGCYDEKNLLERFWDTIASMDQGGHKLQKLVTFNGKGFDLPFLFYRSAVHGIKVAHALGHKAGGSSFHCDLLEETGFFRKLRKFSLEVTARSLGIVSHRTEDYNGKKVWEWFDEGDFEQIARYCYQDVELTEQVYKKLKSSWALFL